jgi:hypothetical protein
VRPGKGPSSKNPAPAPKQPKGAFKALATEIYNNLTTPTSAEEVWRQAVPNSGGFLGAHDYARWVGLKYPLLDNRSVLALAFQHTIDMQQAASEGTVLVLKPDFITPRRMLLNPTIAGLKSACVGSNDRFLTGGTYRKSCHAEGLFNRKHRISQSYFKALLLHSVYIAEAFALLGIVGENDFNRAAKDGQGRLLLKLGKGSDGDQGTAGAVVVLFELKCEHVSRLRFDPTPAVEGN